MTRKFANTARRIVNNFGDGLVRAAATAVFVLLLSVVGYAVPPIRNALLSSFSILTVFAVLVCLAFSLIGAVATMLMIRPKLRRLESEAATDPALSCYNQRECGKRLDEALSESQRYGTVFSVCLCDLDGLKETNDKYGYTSGDFILQEFVQIVHTLIRDTDLLFRYKQGDEFLLLARNTPAVSARVLAERIRDFTERYKFQVADYPEPPRITVSIGVSEIAAQNREKETVGAIKNRAETALAKAKKSRNSVFLLQTGDIAQAENLHGEGN
jgi:diguanylate cyclase (GGDEF)-like protein